MAQTPPTPSSPSTVTTQQVGQHDQVVDSQVGPVREWGVCECGSEGVRV